MAKGKYQQWLEPDGLLLLRGWARDGLTQAEMAGRMGVSRSTFNLWLKKYSAISDAIKRAREVYDSEVVDGLHRRTLGYKVTLKKMMKVKTSKFNAKGMRTQETEVLVPYEEEIYVTPDTMAMIYWLNNRLPEQWRGNKDAQERNRIEFKRFELEQSKAEAEARNANAGLHITFSVSDGAQMSVEEAMG